MVQMASAICTWNDANPSAICTWNGANPQVVPCKCKLRCKHGATCTAFEAVEVGLFEGVGLGGFEGVRCHNLRWLVVQGLRGLVFRGSVPRGGIFFRREVLGSFDVQGWLRKCHAIGGYHSDTIAISRDMGPLSSLVFGHFLVTFSYASVVIMITLFRHF